MRLVVNVATGAVVHRTAMTIMGGQLVMPSAEAAIIAAAQTTGLDPAGLISWPVPDRETAEALLLADLASLVATIEDGQVVGVAIDPEYTPPAPPADQTQVRLAALQAAVDLIPLNTVHNRRWIAQKTRAKTVGISYIKANPGADQATVSAAVLADLEAEFPVSAELGPVVVCPGILMSYAKSAAAAGFIAEATFENLRALIVASSNDDLVQMLAVL